MLPSGATAQPPELPQLRYRDSGNVRLNIERAYTASAGYLAALA